LSVSLSSESVVAHEHATLCMVNNVVFDSKFLPLSLLQVMNNVGVLMITNIYSIASSTQLKSQHLLALSFWS